MLPSGLRVVTQSMPGARSASVAIFVPVGSRHEDEAHAGLSHLLEHLVFKGTRDHPEPGALSQVVEGVGGSINASTDRELTVYSSKVPAEQLGVALHAVSELALHPVLRRTDLSAEKPVIVDEIRMYVDSPSDHVFTLFDELLYGRHPLGREIAGTIGSVRRATHRGVVDHWRAAYRPARVVLAVAGAIDHEQVLRPAAEWDAAGPDPRTAGPPAVCPWRLRRRGPRRAGTLACLPPAVEPGKPVPRHAGRRSRRSGPLGARPPRRDPRRRDGQPALPRAARTALARVRRLDLQRDVRRCRHVRRPCRLRSRGRGAGRDGHPEQLDRISTDPVSPEELERARAYTRGRLELRMEDSGAVAGWIGTGETLLPRILTVDEVIEHLEAVTVDDLLRVARRFLAPSEARLAVLGPFRSRARFERALRS